MAAKKALSEAQHAALKAEMRDLMIQAARMRMTITYSELTMQLQTAYIHYHSPLLVKLLNEIGREENDAGRGALPAVVVAKQTGMPGGGYFGLSAQLDGGDFESAWRADLEGVYDYWANADDVP
jgi:hypothetical protein